MKGGGFGHLLLGERGDWLRPLVRIERENWLRPLDFVLDFWFDLECSENGEGFRPLDIVLDYDCGFGSGIINHKSTSCYTARYGAIGVYAVILL